MKLACLAFADYLQSARGYSNHTVKAYATDVLDLVAWMEKQEKFSLADFELDLIREWLYELDQKGLTKTTLARKSAAIRAFSVWLQKSELIKIDVAGRLKSPKTGRSLPKVVSRETLGEIFENLSLNANAENPNGLRDLLSIELLYASGCRVSELVGLNLEDVYY